MVIITPKLQLHDTTLMPVLAPSAAAAQTEPLAPPAWVGDDGSGIGVYGLGDWVWGFGFWVNVYKFEFAVMVQPSTLNPEP